MILKIIFAFTEFDVDIVDIPDSIYNNKNVIIKNFDKWVYNKDNKLTWDEKNKTFCFRADMFVYWLNKYVLSDKENKEKAQLIESQPEVYDHNLPMLMF